MKRAAVLRGVAARVVAGIPAGVVGILLWGELMHYRSSRRGIAGSAHPQEGRREAIVVLGYRNRGTRANYLNRFRVRAALRSRDELSSASVLIFCGGCVAGTIAEADLMARYAVDQLGYRGPYVLDRASRSTWENIQNAIPHLEDHDVIKIVSNSQHAELGRTYLQKLRPDLAGRLVRAAEYRFGELVVVKVVAAALHLRRQRRRE